MGNDAALYMIRTYETYRQVNCITDKQNKGMLLEWDLSDNLLGNGGGNLLLIHFPAKS